ncbi:MAG TPA: carboxypeptidase regulatory-like domain-containing protein [Bryobacteraceae bacterium]|nr:carboxypeptidase regulatory-like domain-containing protein [Bryobacteraceae bacterium]
MRIRGQFLVAAAGLLFCWNARAQLAAIEGDVKGADGKAIINATVKFGRQDANRTYQSKTDKKGHYFYSGLPPGFYAVIVQVDGKDIAGVSGIRTQPGDPLLVNFDLRNPPQEQESRIKLELKKVGAEWSYVKIMEVQAAAPAQAPVAATGAAQPLPARENRELAPEQRAAVEKQMAERAAAIKQREELNGAFNAGLAAMQARQYDSAVASLSKASEIDPEQEAVWENLGAAYVGLAGGKTGPEFEAAMQKGLEAYAKAVALKPADADVRYSHALALAKARKGNEMQAEISKAAELDPANAYRVYYNLGVLLTNSGQNDAAAEAFKTSITAAPDDPKNAESYYQYGVALVSKAQIGADGKVTPVSGTVEAFQKYLQLAPGGPNAQAATDMLKTLGSSVETQFSNPNQGKKKK